MIDPSMYHLLCNEIETQCKILAENLIKLEREGSDKQLLESSMRAAHSIKGASKIVNLDPIVHLAHTMEDWMVKKQTQKEIQIGEIEVLLQAVDFLSQLARVSLQDLNDWIQQHLPFLQRLIDQINGNLSRDTSIKELAVEGVIGSTAIESVLRMTPQKLNQIMGLVTESLVESRWLYPFTEHLEKMKREIQNTIKSFDQLKISAKSTLSPKTSEHHLSDIQKDLYDIGANLEQRLYELREFTHHYSHLSDRLYNEVVESRFRPFADGTESFPRMVRDLAKQLGKKAHLQIEGESTLVDREVIEKLEAPLTHLLRNAIDHGIEFPEERKKQGKAEEGTITLRADHHGGMLSITLSDDGKGVDLDRLRKILIQKKIVDPEMAYQLPDSELAEFLFIPALSTSMQVSEISGRGVGLDVVRHFVQEVGGKIRIMFEPGRGTTFHLLLPVALSLIHALVVTISKELYAFPLGGISRTEMIDPDKIVSVNGAITFHCGEEEVPLVFAWELLGLARPVEKNEKICIIFLEDQTKQYGLIVDRFISEKTVSVLKIDPRLGNIEHVSSSAIMEDGLPLFILNPENILTSMIEHKEKNIKKKKVLVVDDSSSMRELVSEVLEKNGYEIDTAVNGLDGWNALQEYGHYDLVISDVNMPRLDGIRFVTAIKNDSLFQHIPVIMISYSESEEDRSKGLQAGAKIYLGKSTLTPEILLTAVVEALL